MHTKNLGTRKKPGDVVQDVFLTLWNRKETIQEEHNLSGYLYTAVRNKALNIFAQKKVRDSYEESLLHFANEQTIVTDHLIRERQMTELIEKEITAIPEKMREIFILSRKSYLKNKDIAELLGISEHTVATQIKRALKVLRLRIGLLIFLALFFMR